MSLHPRATAASVRVLRYHELGSTNAEALALAQRGERGPLWITAARQSAGRGRRGRQWISLLGNLHATLLLTPAGPSDCWPQLSFVSGVAAHDAIAEVAGRFGRKVEIKWPNDILLDNRKVAGILIEGQGGTIGGPAAVAIGFGINCASHPADTEFPATDLAAFGASPEAVLAALSAAMFDRLAQWDGGLSFGAIRADWLVRAAGLGTNVRIRLGERDLAGRFETIDGAGGLVLRLHDGTTTTIATGDLFMSPDGSFPERRLSGTSTDAS